MNKRQKREIIERWRSTQLMYGVKEGSILEWRLANSYNNMAIALMGYTSSKGCSTEGHDEIGATPISIFTVTFPIIRQCLTTKNRLTRVIYSEEVLWPLLKLTWKDLFNSVGETNPKLKQKTYRQKKINEFLCINNGCNNTIIDILMGRVFSGDKAVITTDIFEMLTEIDLVASILVMISDYIMMKGRDFISGVLDYKKDLEKYFNQNIADRYMVQN